MPFELRPSPARRLRPEDDYLQSAWTSSVYPLAKQMGVAMVLPKISPQPYSHLAFEGYQHALEHGKANEYNFRVFEAFFQEERDIGEVDVLSKLAADVGLDSDSFQKDLETRKYQEVHQQALQHAYHEARISAVPTFHIGELVLSGLQSKENLEKAITLQIEKL
jgi:predicted DsbA family dithiol-disulfide isomerase